MRAQIYTYFELSVIFKYDILSVNIFGTSFVIFAITFKKQKNKI